MVGKLTKRTYCHEDNDEALKVAVHKFCYDKIYSICKGSTAKHDRSDAFAAVEGRIHANHS